MASIARCPPAGQAHHAAAAVMAMVADVVAITVRWRQGRAVAAAAAASPRRSAPCDLHRRPRGCGFHTRGNEGTGRPALLCSDLLATGPVLGGLATHRDSLPSVE
jgi:hypothetical protein